MSSEGNNPGIWIRETAAPEGYRVITEWIPVNVTASYAESLTVRITVLNEPLGTGTNRPPNLPQTGTMIVTLTGAGITLIITGFVIVQVKRKQQHS